MDENLLWYEKERILRTIKNLKKNNMEGYFVEDEKELLKKIDDILTFKATVGFGGSMTLFETGVIEHLKNKDYKILDRYKEGLTKEDIKKIYRDSFFADAYFSSTNALTENGELYNIDGNGNRIAALIYGPKTVIIVAGKNKIVRDLKEAENRVKNIASPINAKRLNKDTPCAKIGYCVDCSSKDRICSHFLVTARQNEGNKGRIKVIIVNKDLGY
ncbi:lactate utilization protein [Haloimpatiens sp. FM7315]|uniref:lactate utilization protein n=1 Tax=Haloimpatiens sp. FM7315 TaxID=3298609 RepID=UPI00370B23B4